VKKAERALVIFKKLGNFILLLLEVSGPEPQQSIRRTKNPPKNTSAAGWFLKTKE
jgi:hypothetical protein